MKDSFVYTHTKSMENSNESFSILLKHDSQWIPRSPMFRNDADGVAKAAVFLAQHRTLTVTECTFSGDYPHQLITLAHELGIHNARSQ